MPAQFTAYLSAELNSASLKSDPQIEATFSCVAENLLRKGMITVDHRKYLLTEIEFYYWSENHPDPYVHKHPNQLKTGLWYFHDVGQDLTFGSNGSYGGILLRAIASQDLVNYVDGPVKTFDEIFNSELVLDREHTFRIDLSDKPLLEQEVEISDFPRVGMYPKGRDHDEQYLFKPYRYLSYPWLSSAERHVMYLYTKHYKEDTELLEKLKLDKSMIREYDKAFEDGLNMQRSEVDDLMSGMIKMNVINKCRLIGWNYSRQR